MFSKRLIRRIPLACMAVVAACGGGSDGGPTAPPITVAHVDFVGVPATDVMVNDSTTLTVRATDLAGNPLAGVTLTLGASIGTTAASTVTTGADGTAAIKWRSPATIGPATVTITAASGKAATYSATVSRSMVGRWLGPIGSSSLYYVTIQAHDMPALPGFRGYTSPGSFSILQNMVVGGSAAGTAVSMSITDQLGQSVSFIGTLSADGNTMDGQLTKVFTTTAAKFQRQP